jgi:uncharacterized protein (DUF1684 family)
MMVSAFYFFIAAAAAQSQDSVAYKEIENHRIAQEKKFLDLQRSPLSKEQQAGFHHLNFFKPDLKFRVQATFIKNEKPVLFAMRTTGSNLPQYRKYGEVHFQLEGKSFVLEAYQEKTRSGDFGNFLFIPFTDQTNGEETYEIGRYLEIGIPENNASVVIDFNQCFNPYCSYRKGYACEIPPQANDIPLRIIAGEKKYHTH